MRNDERLELRMIGEEVTFMNWFLTRVTNLKNTFIFLVYTLNETLSKKKSRAVP